MKRNKKRAAHKAQPFAICSIYYIARFIGYKNPGTANNPCRRDQNSVCSSCICSNSVCSFLLIFSRILWILSVGVRMLDKPVS